MNQIMNATINWIPENLGGRKTLPTGPIYSTMAHFVGRETEWPKMAWSLILEFKTLPSYSEPTLTTVRFLSTHAPSNLLLPGACFELHEGARVVARGEVNGVADDEHELAEATTR